MSLSLLAAVAASVAPGGPVETATLSPKPIPKWDYQTPRETWIPVDGGIPVGDGGGFLAHPDGVVLMVDRNGDGKVESKIKGVAGYVTLKGKSVVYGVRFMKKGDQWRYSSSSSMTGKLRGAPISLLDLNGNGKWNDYGVDGLVIGGGKRAGLLSKVISIRGDLFDFEVSEDGREVKATPYEGETGELELTMKSRGRLAVATVSDDSGKVSFAFHKNGKQVVPVGSYAVSGGLLVKGKETARLAAGRMKDVQVKANEAATLALGGAVQADFRYEIAGNKLTVNPSSVHYYGQAGEEYVDWVPDNKSPKLVVFDSKKKRPIESGRFASC